MSDLEQLLRDALHDAPPVAPATPDPVAAVNRRVRRARLSVAAVTAAVAAVAVAVVVPFAGTGRSGEQKVQPLGTPTPTPSATSSLPANTTALWTTGGANWASVSPTGTRWLTYFDKGGRLLSLAQVDSDGHAVHQATPPAPAGEVYAGSSVVWVVGSDQGGNILSRVSAYSTSGQLVATKAFPTTLLSFAVVKGDDLYVQTGDDPAKDGVARLRVQGNAIDEADVTLPDHQGNGIAVTANGAVWAETEKHLVEVQATATGLRLGHVTDAWSLHGGNDAKNPDAVWSADGSRLIELTPGLLSSGVSVAQGDRIPVSGTPQLATTDAAGNVYVLTKEETLYAFAAATLGGGNPAPVATADVDGGAVVLVADPAGGVDYVTGNGQLLRWDPVR